MAEFSEDFVKFADPLAALGSAIRFTELLVDRAGPGALTAPTPCGDWTVSDLLNHLVDLAEYHVELLDSGEELSPNYDRPDPGGEFGAAAAGLLAAFAVPGRLDDTVNTQIGPQPGRVVAQHVTNELLVHGWDLAQALDLRSEYAPELAEGSLASWKAFFGHFPRAAMKHNFGAEVPADAPLPALDRLAAYLGRPV